MDLARFLHMSGGEGKHSYARNSAVQRSALTKARQILEETVKILFAKSFPECIAIADLGCSSGPNVLFAISEIVNTILALCEQPEDRQQSPIELQVLLNDLPSNDFNTVFTNLLPDFHKKLKMEARGGNGHLGSTCFVSATPGSFYGRLFPRNSLNFVHSSSSLHWLSQVPDGIENNKGNLCISMTSPGNVLEAYRNQFQKDFSSFLMSRAQELVAAGKMVLTFLGRSIFDPTSIHYCDVWTLLAASLYEMAQEGLVEEDQVDSFSVPIYTPHPEEVRDLVEKEGSFEIARLEKIEVNWDPNDNEENSDYVFDKYLSGQMAASHLRAGSESMLNAHFGQGKLDLDDLFGRYASHVGEYLSKEKPKYLFIVISLTKRC